MKDLIEEWIFVEMSSTRFHFIQHGLDVVG